MPVDIFHRGLTSFLPYPKRYSCIEVSHCASDPQKGTPILGNPKPYKPAYNPSFPFIFHWASGSLGEVSPQGPSPEPGTLISFLPMKL